MLDAICHLKIIFIRIATAVDVPLMELDGFAHDGSVLLNKDIEDKLLHQIALLAHHGVMDVTFVNAQVNFTQSNLSSHQLKF